MSKTFYQILNIAAFYEDINGIIPILMIVLTGKSQCLYDNVFEEIKIIINDNGVKLKEIPKLIMVDF